MQRVCNFSLHFELFGKTFPRSIIALNVNGEDQRSDLNRFAQLNSTKKIVDVNGLSGRRLRPENFVRRLIMAKCLGMQLQV